MKLKLDTVDFDEKTITFKVPEEVYKTLAFASCEMEVDVSPLEELGRMRRSGQYSIVKVGSVNE